MNYDVYYIHKPYTLTALREPSNYYINAELRFSVEADSEAEAGAAAQDDLSHIVETPENWKFDKCYEVEEPPTVPELPSTTDDIPF